MATQTVGVRYNQIHQVSFRAGWIGFFAGESQTKALDRVLDQINARGLRVAAMTVDRWSIWKRILWALVLICTLGFVGRVPNILVVSEPGEPSVAHRESAPTQRGEPVAAPAAPIEPAPVLRELESPAELPEAPRRVAKPATKKKPPAKKAVPAKRSTRGL
jgi:hypothetical protein